MCEYGRVYYNDCTLPSPPLHSGWSWSWQREPPASSQRRCSLRKGQRGQRDWQPVSPAGQETQSEEEEMSRVPPEATNSCLPQRLVLSAVQSVISSTERSGLALNPAVCEPGPAATVSSMLGPILLLAFLYTDWLLLKTTCFGCVNCHFFQQALTLKCVSCHFVSYIIE